MARRRRQINCYAALCRISFVSRILPSAVTAQPYEQYETDDASNDDSCNGQTAIFGFLGQRIILTIVVEIVAARFCTRTFAQGIAALKLAVLAIGVTKSAHDNIVIRKACPVCEPVYINYISMGNVVHNKIEPDVSQKAAKIPKGVLTVKIHDAKLERNTAYFAMDPYIVVKITTRRDKTQVRQKAGQDPYFNE